MLETRLMFLSHLQHLGLLQNILEELKCVFCQDLVKQLRWSFLAKIVNGI